MSGRETVESQKMGKNNVMTFNANMGEKFNDKGGVIFQTGSNITRGTQGPEGEDYDPNFIPQNFSKKKAHQAPPVLPQEQNKQTSVLLVFYKYIYYIN